MCEPFFHYQDFDPTENEDIKRDFRAYTKGLTRTRPGNVVVPPEFKKYGDRIHSFEVRPDDVWLVTFPKSGTKWMEAAIWAMYNNGDFSKLLKNRTLYNWRFIDFDAIVKDSFEHIWSQYNISDHQRAMMRVVSSHYDLAVMQPSPRLIATHLPLYLLPPRLLTKAKVLYMARNPKDVCVSYYYHHRLIRMHDYEGDFQKFFQYFLKDSVFYSPYWPHVIDAWNKRYNPNLLFTFYEDMKEDPESVLKRISLFLGRPVSEAFLEKLVSDLSIKGMRSHPTLSHEFGKGIGMMNPEGHFLRKGIVGDWKNHFTPEMEKQMDEWSKRNKGDCDIKFPLDEELAHCK